MILPSAVEVEKVVLGALLLDSSAYLGVSEFLQEQHFYNSAHRIIYRAISEMHFVQVPVDILTVTEKLSNMGELQFVGGPSYITSLTDRIGSSANTEFHAKILQQKFIQREIIRICEDTKQKAYDDGNEDVFELLNEHEASLLGLLPQRNKGKNIRAIVEAVIKSA